MMTDWHATVEYDQPITEDQAVELVEAADTFVAVRTDTDRGRTWLSFGVEAATLRQATDAAQRRARDLATGTGALTGTQVSIRVLTDADLADEIERPTIPPLVDSTAAREILGGISQQRLSQLLQEHADFPRPIQSFAGGRHVWARATIEAFRDRWERRPGRPRKTTG